MKPLLEILCKYHGLKVPTALVEPFGHKILSRMSAIGITDLQTYIDRVRSDRNERQKIIGFVTINVSRFFRNPLVFEILYRIILPDILRKKEADRSAVVNVWSAGCAKGEEPYSLAILFKALMAQMGVRFDVQIFATDINRDILTEAEKASYGADQVKNVKYGWLKKYFSRQKDQFWLNGEIREPVYLSYYDMTDTRTFVPPESVFGNFDLVLCRNLLIYYSLAYQHVIFDKLYRSLADGGCLVLGSAESLPAAFKGQFSQQDLHSRIFIKQQ